jgi:hypothetical protein
MRRESFEARLLVPVTSGGLAPLETLHGRWGIYRGVIGTAVELPQVRS